jgi:hypothetical protein
MGKKRQSRKKHTNRKMKALFSTHKEPRKRREYDDDDNTGAIVGGIVGFAEGGVGGAIEGAVIGSLFD